MKSVAVLGLGILALTTGGFITAGEAAGNAGSWFEATVAGGLSARPTGNVAFGVVGDSASGAAAFTITLGGDDASGVISASPAPGSWPPIPLMMDPR